MPNYSLGIHVGHDRGVALVKDGMLIGAIAQERIDRIKYSPSTLIPFACIDALLEYHDICIHDIQCIGLTFAAVKMHNLTKYYHDALSEYYVMKNIKLIPVPHHLAHAEAVYCTSDFDKALILIADGGGDIVGEKEESESVFLGIGNEVHLLERRLQSYTVHNLSRKQFHIYPFMNSDYHHHQVSLAKKYEQVTYTIGFGQGEAGKTMGLAAYGTSMLDFENINISSIDFDLRLDYILQQVYANYLYSGEKYYSFINDQRTNIARTVQDYIETVLIKLVRYITQKYQIINLCLGGGLFLNCIANHKILEQVQGIHTHICPASGDDGQAIGAAFAAYKEVFHANDICRTSSVLPYLGISHNNNKIRSSLDSRKLEYAEYDSSSLAKILARELYNNKIIGILQGRSEIGPRALGHRSILANPTWTGMKDHLNEKVKHRESFRPFAPIVAEEKQFHFFELKAASPYMLLAPGVKEDFRIKLPAITHIDGTARVQSISKSNNEFLHLVLTEFEKLSGVPILLNTSFNDSGKPIVECPEDAIKTFLTTEIDMLVLECFLIRK
jgi:carbamoyltransferase